MFIDAYEERKIEKVLNETWGHLKCEPYDEHAGTILFAYGAYGDLIIIRVDFETVPDSPWFFEHLQEFMSDQETMPGNVYRFTGTYTRHDDDYDFDGETELVEL